MTFTVLLSLLIIYSYGGISAKEDRNCLIYCSRNCVEEYWNKNGSEYNRCVEAKLTCNCSGGYARDNDDDDDDNDDAGLGSGAIIGIVIGVTCALLLFVCFACRKKSQKRDLKLFREQKLLESNIRMEMLTPNQTTTTRNENEVIPTSTPMPINDPEGEQASNNSFSVVPNAPTQLSSDNDEPPSYMEAVGNQAPE